MFIKPSWGVTIKCRACQGLYSFLRSELNKLNNAGARMLDYIYHMTQIVAPVL